MGKWSEKVGDFLDDIEVGNISFGETPTLRDQFAMAALELASPYCCGGGNPAEIAEDAYAIADAMLAARDK